MSNIRGSEWNRWDLHVHTASSYDYEYKGADADDLLCEALTSNDIKAVAITDHFTIDKQRIESLRKKAPGIVFFPGVELRTDTGANNLHVILIFSEQSDLTTLSSDFDAIMIRSKAKAADSKERIYWPFKDKQREAAKAGYVLVPVLIAGGKVIEDKGKVCHAHGNLFLHEGVGDTPGKIAFACAYHAP